MDKTAATSRLNKEETVQQLVERHGKFIEKLREVKVRNPVRFPFRDMVMGRLSNGNGSGNGNGNGNGSGDGNGNGNGNDNGNGNGNGDGNGNGKKK